MQHLGAVWQSFRLWHSRPLSIGIWCQTVEQRRRLRGGLADEFFERRTLIAHGLSAKPLLPALLDGLHHPERRVTNLPALCRERNHLHPAANRLRYDRRVASLLKKARRHRDRLLRHTAQSRKIAHTHCAPLGNPQHICADRQRDPRSVLKLERKGKQHFCQQRGQWQIVCPIASAVDNMARRFFCRFMHQSVLQNRQAVGQVCIELPNYYAESCAEPCNLFLAEALLPSRLDHTEQGPPYLLRHSACGSRPQHCIGARLLGSIAGRIWFDSDISPSPHAAQVWCRCAQAGVTRARSHPRRS